MKNLCGIAPAVATVAFVIAVEGRSVMRKILFSGLLCLSAAGCSLHRGSQSNSPIWLSTQSGETLDGAIVASADEDQTDTFDCATSLKAQLAAGYR